MDKLLTVKQAAEYLQIHSQTLYKNKEIPRKKIKGGIRFKESELDKYLEQKSVRINPLNSLQLIDNQSFRLTNPPKNDIIISEKTGGKSEMAKAKFKTRYNFGFGAIYQRKNSKGKIRWYLDYYDAEHKRIQKVAKNAVTWEHAREELRDAVLKEHNKACGIKQKNRKIGFNTFAQTYLNDYISTTRRNYQSDIYRLDKLKNYFKEIDLREITPLMIEKFRASRLKLNNSKSTCNRYLALLKRMYSLAIEEGYAEDNPIKKVKFFSEKDTQKERVLTEEEEKRLMEKCSEQLKPIIIVALNTGMRRAEILNLKWKQVDFKTRKIKVDNTKSGKVRYISINTPLLVELIKLKENNGHYHYLFFNPETKKPYLDMKKGFKAACRRAGIENMRFHDLRHTFASRLIERGVDVETVRSLLGHHSITITQRYTHSSDDRKRKAVESLSEKTGKNEANLLHIRDTEKKYSIEKPSDNPVSTYYLRN